MTENRWQARLIQETIDSMIHNDVHHAVLESLCCLPGVSRFEIAETPDPIAYPDHAGSRAGNLEPLGAVIWKAVFDRSTVVIVATGTVPTARMSQSIAGVASAIVEATGVRDCTTRTEAVTLPVEDQKYGYAYRVVCTLPVVDSPTG